MSNLPDTSEGLDWIALDFDDYFPHVIETHPSAPKSASELFDMHDRNGQASRFVQLTDAYYYLVRNSIVFSKSTDSTEEAFRRTERRIFDWCSDWARLLAHNEISTGIPATPGWIKNILSQIRQTGTPSTIATLELVDIKVLHTNSQMVLAQHRSNKFSLTISSIVKPLFINYNLLVFRAIKGKEALPARELTLRFLPYFLHSYFDINPSRLPRLWVFGIDDYQFARDLAQHQLTFLILHELGHVELGHFTSSKSKAKIDKEIEADGFAANSMFRWPAEELPYVLLAIHILYSFLGAAIETGNLVRPYVKEGYQARDNLFAARYDALTRMRAPVKASDAIRDVAGQVSELLGSAITAVRSMNQEKIAGLIQSYNLTDEWSAEQKWRTVLATFFDEGN